MLATLGFTLAVTTPAAPVHASATPMDWSEVIQKVLPAVVNISVETLTTKDGTEQRQREVGTGFLVDSSGTIVTNKHVIAGAFRIRVTLADHSQWDAKLLAAARTVDLAVLKIDTGHPTPFLKFADSDNAKVGDPVIVIGNPLGLGTSASAGIVSALHRDLMNTPFDNYIQTDAAINHGNSGGPVLDRNGDVLGVATILVTNSDGEGSNGLGFALAGSDTEHAVQHLLHPESGTIGWIGAHLQDLTPSLEQAFHTGQLAGVLVTQVEDDSPADNASIQTGDVIVLFGHYVPTSSHELMRQIFLTPAGDDVPIKVWRDGKILDLDVIVADWPKLEEPEGAVTNTMENAALAQAPDFGLILAPLTGASRRDYKISATRGVVVAAVDQASEAFSDGIAAGDVILEVEGKPVSSPGDVSRAVEQAKINEQFIDLLVAKKDDTRWVALYSGHAPGSDTLKTVAEAPDAATASATAGARQP